MSNPSHIVVAHDFSATGEVVDERAIALACESPQKVLHFLVIIDDRHGVAAVPVTGKVDFAYSERVQAELSQLLHRQFEAHHAPAEVHFFVHARIGKPAEEILRLAGEVGAELVMVGSHGLTGLERMVLGSVSERVVREARCPVLVVRQRTYPDVALLDVKDNTHATHHAKPHRFSYQGRRVNTRPPDWPLI